MITNCIDPFMLAEAIIASGGKLDELTQRHIDSCEDCHTIAREMIEFHQGSSGPLAPECLTAPLYSSYYCGSREAFEEEVANDAALARFNSHFNVCESCRKTVREENKNARGYVGYIVGIDRGIPGLVTNGVMMITETTPRLSL